MSFTEVKLVVEPSHTYSQKEVAPGLNLGEHPIIVLGKKQSEI